MSSHSWRMSVRNVLVLSLATMPLAQNTPSIAAKLSTTTSSAPAATHTIQVGNGDHKFKPDTTKANIGDVVEFHFYPSNHSVVRAEYEYPCIPYEMTGPNKVGFWSGFNPVDEILPDPPKYRIIINDTKPVFFYCSAPGSCTDWGMVGAINPNSASQVSHQRELATSAAYSLNPGEPFPDEASPLPTPSSSPSSSAPSGSRHLAPGAIAGIVVGSVLIIALLGGLFFFIGRSKTLKEEMRRKSSTIRHTRLPSPSPMLHSNPFTVTNPFGDHRPPPAAYMPPQGNAATVPRYGRETQTQTPPVGDGEWHGAGVNRAASRRSVGGTFGISPTTGYYTRTHDGEDTYKYTSPKPSDTTSPLATHHQPTARPQPPLPPHYSPPQSAISPNGDWQGFPASAPAYTNAQWRKAREAGFDLDLQRRGSGSELLGPYGRQVVGGGDVDVERGQSGWGGSSPLGQRKGGRGLEAVNEGAPAEMDGSPVERRW